MSNDVVVEIVDGVGHWCSKLLGFVGHFVVMGCGLLGFHGSFGGDNGGLLGSVSGGGGGLLKWVSMLWVILVSVGVMVGGFVPSGSSGGS